MGKLSVILAAIGALAASGIALRRYRRRHEAASNEGIPGQFTHGHDAP
jgi:hypothetical protein